MSFPKFRASVAVVLMAMSGNVAAADFGGGDIAKMHSEYEANQARFMRNYKGKSLDVQMTMAAVTENIIFKGTYDVTFGKSTWGDIRCNISDPKQIDYIINKNKGDLIHVNGVIDDHLLGAVVLRNCALSN